MKNIHQTNCKNLLKVLAFIAICPVLFSGAIAQTNGTWSATSGSGDWSDPNKWADGIIPGSAGSVVSLERPSVDGSYTISLDGDRTIGVLEQLGNGWTTAGAYTITGADTLTFDAGAGVPTIALSATETSNSFTRALTISSNVQGTDGLTISGSGRRQLLRWTPGVMGLTGGFTLEGVGLEVESAAALGSNTITFSGSGGINFLAFSTDGQTYNNDVILNHSTSGFMNMIGSGSVVGDPPTHTLAGDISETGGARNLYFMTATNTAGGTRFVVSGNNSYTGSTFVNSSQVNGVPMNSGPIVVRAVSDTAFGVGASATIQPLNTNSGVELANNITITNKQFRLNGKGFRDQGSLNSVNGDNTWAGTVYLRYNSSRDDTPTIGVEADSLTVTGVVQDGSASLGLHKVGAGALVLSGNNTYASGTVIIGGLVIADHNNALGSGGVNINGGGLKVASGRTINNTISFGASGGSVGGYGTINSAVALNNVNQVIDPGGSIGEVTFGVAQTWSAFSYNWELDNWSGTPGTFDTIVVDGALSLSAVGEYQLNIVSLDGSGNPGMLPNFDEEVDGSWTILTASGITDFDAATWTMNLAGFENAPLSAAQWSLDQVGNSLVLNYSAVPEPTTVALFGLGLLFLARRSGRTGRGARIGDLR